MSNFDSVMPFQLQNIDLLLNESSCFHPTILKYEQDKNVQIYTEFTANKEQKI